MASRYSLFFSAIIFFSTISSFHAGVICDQLSALSPGIIKFLSHPHGSLIAAQEATTGPETQLSFYRFQKGNSEGKKPRLTLQGSLPNENAQRIIQWAWSTQEPLLCYATTHGKLAICAVPSPDSDQNTDPYIVGEKYKDLPIHAISWNNEGDVFAVIIGSKLAVYAVNPESKKRPIKRISSCEIALDTIQFLMWSHDDSLLAVGNNEKITIWRTKTPSGTFKLAPYLTQELDTALHNISGSIKDIAWNKIGNPTLALLSKRLMLISFQPQEGGYTLLLSHNIAHPTTTAIAWNTDPRGCTREAQELIATRDSAQFYQVYVKTSNSLLYDSSRKEFLPPYQQPEASTRPLNRFEQKGPKHHLSDETMIELVNKISYK